MVSTRDLQQQLQLRHRYSIHQTLGARLGRRTLLGHDHHHNCPVIIKYLCFKDPLQSNDIKRFREEIAVLKQLDHPAIPNYIDSFEIDEHGYAGLMLIQTYIEGKSLYALVNEQTAFTETDIRSLAQQILAILDYLHNQKPGVIHRDIKPSSLVLSYPTDKTPAGTVYLVDFGLVQRGYKNQTMPGEELILISGTPGYRPPEQLGDRAVPATDLYSLGATLIHLATGKHPKALPHRGLRLLFGQELGHMSRPLKAWLRWLTQPKQHKRPLSAHAALEGLTHADTIFTPSQSLEHLGQRLQQTFLKKTAPVNTQLKIFEYSQTLELVFPPLGWKTLQFGIALLQTVTGILGIWAICQGLLYLWPQLAGFWQHLLAVIVSWGWTYVSLRFGYRGFRKSLITLLQQVSIQLLPDIMLLGYRLPCRPVEYQVNTYKRDISDIDLQPGSSTITLRLHNNRTAMGKVVHQLSAGELGVTQSEISWVNDILQLWLKQKAPSL
ncbi:MAG: serine/threonine-protein kinase [Cyanobacteria bacterium P01_C01_bin.118]